MSSDRTYDVILFGATGFTGELTAKYLATQEHCPALRWAIAGRNTTRLAQVKTRLETLNPACSSVGIVEASIDDAASVAHMASQTRVLLTTVGPYAEYGEPVVKACVQEGTDYADMTGEPNFVDSVVERYHHAAKDRGVRIVNCCGLDSIPSDLGALFTVGHLPNNEPIVLEAFFRAEGRVSGGTWASALGAFADMRRPKPHHVEGNGRRVQGLRPRVRYDRKLHSWLVPTPMIDPQIVLRTARTLDAYGPDFRYAHYIQMRSGPKLAVLAAGFGAAIALSQLSPTRQLLRKIRPIGTGPTDEQRSRGWFQLTFQGQASSKRVVTRVSGGEAYEESAKMIAEAGLCLAFDREQLPGCSGVLTPAVAMGQPLISRLLRAGLRFEVIEG